MTDNSEDTVSKGLVILGRDVSKMPCFRNSYLYGIGGGLTSGLLYFMFTSKVKSACNFGMLGFTLVTLGYWTQCRYNYSSAKFEMLRLQEMMRQQNLYEGTEREKELDKPVTVQEV